MFPPSDFLCVDHVILSVRSNEADVNDPIGIVDPHHQPVLVARNIEHHAAVLEDTRAANRPFHVRRRLPVCCLDLPIPRHQRLACIGMSGASIEERLERAERNDPHLNHVTMVPHWDQAIFSLRVDTRPASSRAFNFGKMFPGVFRVRTMVFPSADIWAGRRNLLWGFSQHHESFFGPARNSFCNLHSG